MSEFIFSIAQTVEPIFMLFSLMSSAGSLVLTMELDLLFFFRVLKTYIKTNFF